jgi:hypothetical protein|tara:strand:+ start:1568 stop:1693 length:126 start_codon:yes stop_codon:yes gene_type:complete
MIETLKLIIFISIALTNIWIGLLACYIAGIVVEIRDQKKDQ